MGHTNKPTPTALSPSPLMGEESKVRVKTSQHQPPPARHTGLYPSFPRRRETTGRGQPGTTPRHCGLDPQSRGAAYGRADNKPTPTNTNQHRPVILASRQYPQCEGNTKTPTPVTPQTQSHHHQSTTYKARQTDQTHLYPNPCPNPQDATVCRYYRRISEQTHPHPNLRF